MEKQTLHLGDNIDILKTFPDNYIDGVVTDPPAGISFMGKTWDSDFGGRDEWIKWMQLIAEGVYRVLKPGAYCLVWAIPRTSHWTAMAWENAGFNVRDKIIHMFGSGFPKSHNIGKAVDKLQGNEREDLGIIDPNTKGRYKGTSKFEGYGTALKPAYENYLLLQKPISEKSIALNVLKWGTGGINIDGCRVPIDNGEDVSRGGGLISIANSVKNGGTNEGYHRKWYNDENNLLQKQKEYDEKQKEKLKIDRFPANLIHDGSEEVLSVFPETKGEKRTSKINHGKKSIFNVGTFKSTPAHKDNGGSASRFFYCAKPSKAERNAGLEGFEEKFSPTMNNGIGVKEHNPETATKKTNHHPTVKPVKLMEYLVKLITPPNDDAVILDLFMGSGTTGIACANLGINFIGIEKEKEYYEIAKARIKYAQKMKNEQLFVN